MLQLIVEIAQDTGTVDGDSEAGTVTADPDSSGEKNTADGESETAQVIATADRDGVCGDATEIITPQIKAMARGSQSTHIFRKFSQVLKRSQTSSGLNEVSSFLLPKKSGSKSLPSMFQYGR